MDKNVHRMLVGGPLDNQIIYVDSSMMPYKVHLHDSVPPSVVPTKDAEVAVTVDIGCYYSDSFINGKEFKKEMYYRWEGWSRKLAAKIYMWRMGASFLEISGAEWHGWE